MDNKTMYRILVVTVFMLLMSVGIYIGLEISDNKENDNTGVVVSNTDNIKIYDDELVKNIEEEKITDVYVKYSDVYPDCGHTIEQEEKYLNTTKQKIKKEIEEKDTTYKLIGEQDGVLIYQKVHPGKCMNHYKICLEEGIVKIYRTDEEGEYVLYQDTEITKEMLREGIDAQLEEGIYVDDIEELFLIMEDIES